MTFEQLGLSAPILKALKEQGYVNPSPIQEKAIPPALTGRDVLGCAQTGTGKTCAFAAPILQRLDERPAQGRPIRALILTPTRELAIQIGESFDAYGKYLKLRHTVIFGGVGQNPQVEALKRGVDILVATPGRLMDLYQQGFVALDRLEIFVLDEADRMLDMGFIHDVKKILKWLPAKKQTMLFSATMPGEVMELVNSLLRDPARVAVDPVSSPVEAIEQRVCFVDKGNKTRLLAWLLEHEGVKNALVFTRTKHGANKVASDLVKSGITAAAIHGNKSQTARQQALADFKAGKVQCLVATDIAARGIDIEELSLVFNYNLPEVPETYVLRIGRTGRAGHGGTAISFCDFAEREYRKGIEKLIGKKLPVVEGHPWPMEVFEAPRDAKGRTVNADDAEARAAARERKALRDAAQKRAQPVPAPEAAAPTPARKKRKPNWQKAEGERAGRLDAVLPERSAGPVEADYGDFNRPDPLGEDRIMDATARLLAPRPRMFSQRPEAPAPERRARKKNKSAAGPAAEPPERPAQGGRGKRREEGKSAVPAPVQAVKKRHDRGRGHRAGPVMPTRSSSVKDSTEQPSLMKPYYLNDD